MDETVWKDKLTHLNNGLSEDYIEKVNEICAKKLPGYWELSAMGGLTYKNIKFSKVCCVGFCINIMKYIS